MCPTVCPHNMSTPGQEPHFKRDTDKLQATRMVKGKSYHRVEETKNGQPRKRNTQKRAYYPLKNLEAIRKKDSVYNSPVDRIKINEKLH